MRRPLSPNRPTLRDVENALLTAPEFLKSLGLSAADFTRGAHMGVVPALGQGEYAFAFELPSGRVLKVTDDPDDAQAADAIRAASKRGGAPPGLPLIYDVRKFPAKVLEDESDGDHLRFIYAIVSERVRPLRQFVKHVLATLGAPGITDGDWVEPGGMSLKSLLGDMVLRETWTIREAANGGVHSSRRPLAETLASKEAISSGLTGMLDQAMQGAKWLSERGIHVTDLHPGNLGLTTGGDAVIFDLGHRSVSASAKSRRIRMAKNPLPIDNEHGIGATGNNANIDYAGLRVRMKPSVFHRLTLALPRGQARSADALKKKVAEGARFGAPTLYLEIPEEWEDGDLSRPATVSGHEGRNRMYVSQELYGDDDPVETHIFPGHYYRARHMTAAWIERLSRGLVSERHSTDRGGDGSLRETAGPLFFIPFDGEQETMSKNTGGHSMSKVHAAFDRCFDVIERDFSDFGDLELHEDEAAGGDNGHGSERQFGYCAAASDDSPILIAFAAKTEKLPRKYIDGLMAHEFGHALEYRYGVPALEKKWGKLPASIERRADKIAEHTFGHRIEYGDMDVQCIACDGKKTRPRRLG